MKEIEIVMAGAFGQVISGPYTESGQAEQVKDEVNALLTDPLDKAVVVKVRRRTPKEIADLLNEVEVSAADILLANSLGEDEPTPVCDPFVVPDGVDDTESGEG